MRSIETSAEKERRQKRKVRIISLILLFIMVVGTIGYAFVLFSENNINAGSIPSGNGQLQTESGQWILPFEGQGLLLQTSKESVKDIPVEIFLNVNNYRNPPIYIDSDNSTVIYQEIAYNLNPFVSKLPIEACYGPCAENLPEKNCSDYLIVYNRSNENRVYQQENCIMIEGDIKGVDAFLYKIFEEN
ncbi:MAG: hypothetical protein Q8Q31_02825 [Nanoarchaeota archaeon]|nr:hypothetical protein [Nanoarchaeota archaeon]